MFRLLLCLSLLIPALAQAISPTSLNTINPNTCQRIATGPGPDDLTREPLPTPRVIFSSHDRRNFRSHGHIYSLELQSDKPERLSRQQEPEGFVLRPHGLDLVQRDGRWWLYVINHDRDLFSDRHALAVYELVGNTLIFQELLSSPLLSSPNDVAVADNGDIYVTNEREDGSSIAEMLFLQRKANVVVYRPQIGWRIAADDFAFANGILIQGNTVWVTQSLGEGVRRYQRAADGRLVQRESLGNLSLLDSIQVTESGYFLIPAYPSLANFLLHWQSPSRRSPAKVYAVDPQTGKGSIIFADDGRVMSAISTALPVKNQVFFGQVFDAFILRCPITF